METTLQQLEETKAILDKCRKYTVGEMTCNGGLQFQFYKNFLKKLRNAVENHPEKFYFLQVIEEHASIFADREYVLQVMEDTKPAKPTIENSILYRKTRDWTADKGLIGKAFLKVMDYYNRCEQKIDLLKKNHESGKLSGELSIPTINCYRVCFFAGIESCFGLCNPESLTNEDVIRHSGHVCVLKVQVPTDEEPHPLPVYPWDRKSNKCFEGPIQSFSYETPQKTGLINTFVFNFNRFESKSENLKHLYYLVPEAGDNGEIVFIKYQKAEHGQEKVLRTVFFSLKGESLAYAPGSTIIYGKDNNKDPILAKNIIASCPTFNQGVLVLEESNCYYMSELNRNSDTYLCEKIMKLDAGSRFRAVCTGVDAVTSRNNAYLLYIDEYYQHWFAKISLVTNRIESVMINSTVIIPTDRQASLCYVPRYNELIIYFKTTGKIDAFHAETGEWIREYRTDKPLGDDFWDAPDMERNVHLMHMESGNKFILFTPTICVYFFYTGGQQGLGMVDDIIEYPDNVTLLPFIEDDDHDPELQVHHVHHVNDTTDFSL